MENRVSKWLINSVLSLNIILTLIWLVKGKYKTDLNSSFCSIVALLLFNWLMPKWNPSIYHTYKLSRCSRFFYFDSFTLVFVTKIILSLFLKVFLDILDPSSEFTELSTVTSAAQFVINLGTSIPIFFATKIMYKRTFGGFIPYIPSVKEIEKLEILMKPELLQSQQLLKLSYHLLKFMQENRKYLFEDEIKAKPQDVIPSFENKDQHGTNKTGSSLSHSFCQHPFSRLRFFSIPSHVSTSTTKEISIPSLPLGSLQCQNCQQNLLTVDTLFTKRDHRYTHRRFDISFELRAADAVIRGSEIARQFQFDLPQVLSLIESTKFSF